VAKISLKELLARIDSIDRELTLVLRKLLRLESIVMKGK